MTLWAFDIETELWDRFVLGAAVADDGRVLKFWTPGEVSSWYLSLPSSDTVLSHNGGRFDFLFLTHIIRDRRWIISTVGSTILRMFAKTDSYQHAICVDSLRLFPMSLKAWTLSKDEMHLRCSGDSERCDSTRRGRGECEGYCSISSDLPRRDLSLLMDYCVQDCVALLSQWHEDIGFLESLGLQIRGKNGRPRSTIGAVAWATAKSLIDPAIELNDPESMWQEYDSGRRAYYGGRVEVGRTRAESGFRYDVNSMYPWALTFPVPYGRMTPYQGSAAAACFDRGEPGAYYAEVYTGPELPPLLPMRAGRGEKIDDEDPADCPRIDPGRLLWSVGHLSSWWTGHELTEAAERGARINRIVAAKIWPESAPLYKPYVEMVYGARERAKITAAHGATESIRAEADRRSALLKWFANSLSGKLAQGTEVETAYITPPDPENPPPIGASWGGRDLITVTHERMPSSGYPIQAAYLTSRARIALLDRIIVAGDGFIYCDTDSCYSSEPDTAGVHESRLGAWALEGRMSDWVAIAPKMYSYIDESGASKARAKGIPRANRDDVLALMNGDSVEARIGVQTLKMARGDFRARTVKRKSTRKASWAGLRRIVDSSGSTRPLNRSSEGILT